MAGTTSKRGPSRTGQRGLRRGSLTPELIVKESLKLLDDKGLDGFSMPKLGRALGADPTAVYRHFSSKDDLVLAIADQLIEDAMVGLAPHACWVDTVTDIVRRIRRTYCDHPAAASLAAYRITQRPAEMKIADTLIGAILDAGFEGRTAARVYRAIADFTLAGASCEAALHAPETRLQEKDRAAWVRTYRGVDRAEHPYIWQLREELPDVTDDDVFETILSLLIGGLTQIAPRPCGCRLHDPQHVEIDRP